MQSPLCPICSRKLGFFGTAKISGGVRICRSCAELLRVDPLRLPYLTVGEAVVLAKKGRENLELFKTFKPTRQVSAVDFWLRVDDEKGLWYVCITKKPGNPPIYPKSALLGYRLLENGQMIAEHRRGRDRMRGASPDYDGYDSLRSMRFQLDIDGYEDGPLEMELVGDSSSDIIPGSVLYRAYQSEAADFSGLMSSILDEGR